MQHDAADELDRVRPQAQNPVGSFPDGGEGFGQDVVQGLALCQTVFKFLCLALQGFLGKRHIFRFQGQDLVHGRLDLLDFPLGTGAE